MKRITFSITLIVALCLTSFLYMTTAHAATTISTCAELQNIDLSTDYILESDINCDVAPYNTGAGFTPIGDHNGARYSGDFNGQGHTITGLFIDADADYVGLFADLAGNVYNLSITDASVAATGSYVGVLTGNVREPVDNVHVQGTVTGDGTVGGFAGTVNDLISNSSADVTVNGHSRTGGFAGYIDEGSIEDSYATGDVIMTTENEAAGGFIGNNGGSISGSYATGTVTAPDTVKVGGFAGYSGGLITDCHATGDVEGKENVGGFAGHSSGGLYDHSYATGDVTTDGFNYVGGFIGGAVGDTHITESLATGNVSGVGYDAGGFAGYVESSTIDNTYARGDVSGYTNVGGHTGFADSATIQKSYSTGVPELTDEGDNGGLVGGSSSTDSEGSFWDEETSGMSGSAEGTAKSTAEMKDVNTFLDANWDFEGIWTIDEFNDGYPRFGWYTPPAGPSDDDRTAYTTDTPTGKQVILHWDYDCEVSDFAVKSESANSTQDVAYSYPNGLVSFTFADCSASSLTVDVTYVGVSNSSFVLRKYTPASSSYTTVSDAALVSTTVDGKPAVKATYTIADNGPLDTNPAVGTISDPAGIAQAVIGAPRTGGGGTAH